MSTRHPGTVISFSGVQRFVTRHNDAQRLALAKDWIRFVAKQKPLVICLPAGFLWAATLADRDYWVTQLMMLSAECGIALSFGIDLSTPAPARQHAVSGIYLCHRGRLICLIQSDDEVRSTRCLWLEGWKVGLLLAREIFPPESRHQAMALRPDLWLLHSHVGATRRWRPALQRLARSAPVVLVGGQQQNPEVESLLVSGDRVAVTEAFSVLRHLVPIPAIEPDWEHSIEYGEPRAHAILGK